MPIGDSKGAFFDDEFRQVSAPWFIDPKMEITPNESNTNKALDAAELDPTSGMGIEIADRISQAGADSFKGGYLGSRPLGDGPDSFWMKDDWQNTWDSAVGKSHYGNDPKGYVDKLGPDYEGFNTEGSELLWLRKRAKPPEKLPDLTS